MTADDVMIIFDAKGDFYNSFYRPGDVVISNDYTATESGGVDYWNVFNEIENDEHMEENIVEISKALFHQKLEKTNQPFCPNAAKKAKAMSILLRMNLGLSRICNMFTTQ